MDQILDESFSFALWPDATAHRDQPALVFANPDAPVNDRDITDVWHPRVYGYTPRKPNGRAALVLAGGGYTKLVVGYEGVEVARWLNDLGFHAFVLVHRFPCERWAVDGRSGSQAPVDDAIEAMRQIRARRAEWGIGEDEIGVVGLSSGGHLAACLIASYPIDWRAPESKHSAVNHRPDFLVVGYAPISTNATGRTIVANKPPLPPPEKQALYEAMQPDTQLNDDPPPAFIIYSAADPVVPVENAFRLASALRAKQGTAELHVFAQGKHGFALREKVLPIGQWPRICSEWFSNVADKKPLPDGVHIILGDSAGGIFARNFGRKRLLVDQDIVSWGPTPRCADFEEWTRIRNAFWNELVPGLPGDASSEVHALINGAHRIRSATRIYIWAGTGLNEQLFISFACHVATASGADPSRLMLIQFETTPSGDYLAVGTGLLNEENMLRHPVPRQMTEAELGHYQAAWTALTDPDPTSIEQFSVRYPDSNRWLQRAMALMLRRFPDKASGLAYADFALLVAVRDRGPKVSRVIGDVMTNGLDEADLVGDWYLCARLHRLASRQMPQPLVEIAGEFTNMQAARVSLTEFGRAVVSGEKANYPTNPIEDWVAGVKISSESGNLWFHDKGRLVRGGSQ